MNLFDRQAKLILDMESSQRSVLLESVLSARDEIRNLLNSYPDGDKVPQHFLSLDRQINEILSRVDPQLSTVPYAMGQAFGIELVNQSSGASLALPILNLEALSAINLEAVNKITQITEELKRTVDKQLRISLALGEGIQEATERIAVTGFRRSLWRYELVARTVTNEMVNAGCLSSYAKLAEENPNLRLRKQWSSVLDKRTSPPCQALDGEIQPIDKPFSLGRMYPPQLPNCRSRVLPVTAKYNPEPEIPTPIQTGDRITDRSLRFGKSRLLDTVPDLRQGIEDYRRLKTLMERPDSIAPKLIQLSGELQSGKITQEEFAKRKAQLFAQWDASALGKSYNELQSRLDAYPKQIFQAGNLTQSKLVKYQSLVDGLRSPNPDLLKDKDRPNIQRFTDQQISMIKPILKDAIAILPPDCVDRLPPIIPLNRSYYLRDSHIALDVTYTDRFLKSSAIHEPFHSLEHIRPEALRQSITLRNALTEELRTVTEPNGKTYQVAVGKMGYYGDYGGRIYSGDRATELYTISAQSLLTGFEFFDQLLNHSNPLYLLMSHLDLK